MTGQMGDGWAGDSGSHSAKQEATPSHVALNQVGLDKLTSWNVLCCAVCVVLCCLGKKTSGASTSHSALGITDSFPQPTGFLLRSRLASPVTY